MGRSAKVAVAGPGWSVADVPGPRAGTGTGTMRRRAMMSRCPASVAGALATVHYLGPSPVPGFVTAAHVIYGIIRYGSGTFASGRCPCQTSTMPRSRVPDPGEARDAPASWRVPPPCPLRRDRRTAPQRFVVAVAARWAAGTRRRGWRRGRVGHAPTSRTQSQGPRGLHGWLRLWRDCSPFGLNQIGRRQGVKKEPRRFPAPRDEKRISCPRSTDVQEITLLRFPFGQVFRVNLRF